MYNQIDISGGMMASPVFRGQSLRLRQVRAVLAIAEQGSLLKAARALGTSQPAVTKVLREVEDAVGVPIFDRLPRGVLPNDYGRAFIARARRAPGEIDGVADDIARIADGQAGTIVVGALPSA